MARIRTIKPEFPQSETVGTLSRDARLLFIQLWTIADDAGRARAADRLLAGQLYPYDDDAPQLIGGWLAELESKGFVRRYEVDGTRYLDIPTWSRHQRIDNAGKSHIPEHPGKDVRREPPRTAASGGEPPLVPSTLDLVPRTSAPDGEEKQILNFRKVGEGRPSGPKHGAVSKSRGTVYIRQGTADWQAYVDDHRLAVGWEPQPDQHGGHWFKIAGAQPPPSKPQPRAGPEARRENHRAV